MNEESTLAPCVYCGGLGSGDKHVNKVCNDMCGAWYGEMQDEREARLVADAKAEGWCEGRERAAQLADAYPFAGRSIANAIRRLLPPTPGEGGGS